MKTPLCPRCGKEPAIVSSTFGVLPGKKCQRKDSAFTAGKGPEFYNISKMDRIQKDRDHHAADHLQPYLREGPNPDYFRRYPEQAETYGVEEELAKL